MPTICTTDGFAVCTIDDDGNMYDIVPEDLAAGAFLCFEEETDAQAYRATVLDEFPDAVLVFYNVDEYCWQRW